jgi:hypothetical protein
MIHSSPAKGNGKIIKKTTKFLDVYHIIWHGLHSSEKISKTKHKLVVAV